jgi:NAD-dependent DNA ligase
MIDQAEAENIFAWLDAHRACLDTWPANILYARLRRMLADGALDDQEQGDLLGLVLQIAQPRTDAGIVVPSTLPLDTPPPAVLIEGRSFCFTGVFDFGTRADCQAAVSDRGGICLHGITKKLHYLVIGNIGSETWRHSSFGAKIVKAVDYRESGLPIAVVSEGHWAAHL